ncbi:MAG TPA: hydroxymethylbilane synthase [Candidatus Paceibacterota bacterium]
MLEIRIGTRGSELALCQATLAREAILKNYPEANVTLKVIKTTGDVKLGPIPETVVGKSWFTKEIEDELLNETIDLAVHSLKDMALMPPPELYIGAMLPREDARDVLVTRNKEKLKELKSAASIGTDSARRGIQICALQPDLKVRSVRGNIGTRLLKLDSMEYDALVLAAAGLVRLGLIDRVAQFFSFDEILPSPGQGILAIELKRSRKELVEITRNLNHRETELVGRTERAFSETYGGGCKKPVAAYAEIVGNSISLRAMVANDAGVITKRTAVSDLYEGQKMAQELAVQLLDATK